MQVEKTDPEKFRFLWEKTKKHPAVNLGELLEIEQEPAWPNKIEVENARLLMQFVAVAYRLNLFKNSNPYALTARHVSLFDSNVTHEYLYRILLNEIGILNNFNTEEKNIQDYPAWQLLKELTDSLIDK